MTKKQALLKSIKHWEENTQIKTIKEADVTSSSCALCEKYYDGYIVLCKGCPLEKAGQGCNSNTKSIYRQAEYQAISYAGSLRVFKHYANELLQVLLQIYYKSYKKLPKDYYWTWE